MRSTRSRHLIGRVGGILIVVASLVGSAFAASTPKVIYSFMGGSDGEYTDTELVVDGAGNLYGTSVQGGTFGGGTVFELSPSASGWTHTVLYNFTGGADGGNPVAALTLDKNGNLYGTNDQGGSPNCILGCGVVFKLAP